MMKYWLILCIPLIFISSACTPSEAEFQATVTQVAAELYGTQTANAPTATATYTPTNTPTATASNTPTATPTITNTPPPPTATLTAAGVDELLLCYRAAVSVHADWAVHDLIIGNSHRYTDALFNELNAFLRERTYRAGAIRISDKLDLPFGDDTITVNGIDIQANFYGREKCESNFGSITSAAEGLRQGSWGVGASSRMSMSRTSIRKAVSKIRKGLLEVYGIDPTVLQAIEEPLWQYVHDRYGVELPD
jgi:hypothetical protein